MNKFSRKTQYSVLNDTERNVNEQMIDVVKYLIKYHQLIWIVSFSQNYFEIH